MFCSKCGSQLAEGTRFCGVCGNTVEQPQPEVQAQPQPEVQAQPQFVPQPEVQAQPQFVPQPEVQAQPQYAPQYAPQPQYQQPATYVKPMGRQKFNYTRGGAVSWISFIALLLAFVLIGVCTYNAMCGSIMDMPIVSMAPEDSVKELENIVEEGKNTSAQSWEALEELRAETPDMSDDEEEAIEAAEEMLEKMDDMLDNLSVVGMFNAISSVRSNEYVFEAMEKSEGTERAEAYMNDLQELEDVLLIVIGVLSACFGVAMLLTLLAAFFRSTALTVFGMLASFGICLVLGSAPLALVILVLDILGIILNSVLKKKYKTYKRQIIGY